MIRFRVYCPDMESADHADVIRALSPDEAALEYAERSYRDEPWEGGMDVRVSGPEQSEFRFWVTPENEPVFYVRKA